MSNQGLLATSIARKVLMALTGLFLTLFLVVHLAGNLQLIPGLGTKEGFNEYAIFMTTFPLIKITSYGLYATILGHALLGLVLTLQNRKARPEQYAYSKPSRNSNWASRNMGLLGTVIFVFIVLHMRSFWFEYHWGELPLDANGNRDLHAITVAAFHQWWYALIYVVAMAALAFHLLHGFQSAFQSLGWNHPKYTPIVKNTGAVLSIALCAGFALIAVLIFIDQF
jgi:succinate dehydrogenase / fumarate reductase cytochrome b subunit